MGCILELRLNRETLPFSETNKKYSIEKNKNKKTPQILNENKGARELLYEKSPLLLGP